MKVLRRFFATICFVLGVIALVLWGVSALVVKTVEDGTVVTGVVQKVVEQPAVTDFITEKAQVLVTTTLSDNGVDLAALGLQGTMDDAVAAAVVSPEFQASLAESVDEARADFAEQLTSPASEGEPLTLHLDVSAVLNETVASTPVVGPLVPTMTLPAIDVEVADANAFGKIRGTYGWIDRFATWAGWAGLLLIGAGIALTPRKRWLIPLGLLWAGLGAGALWTILQWLTVERIAGRLPGGVEGDLGSALLKVAQQDSLDAFAGRVLVVSVVCLVAAALAFIVIKVVSGKGRPSDDRPHGRHEAHQPEHAR